MTPTPPSQRCEHECVCNKYIDYTNTGATAGRVCNGETWCFKPCPHDTRLKHALIISNTRTGEQYTSGYDPHLNGLQQLCIDAGLSDRLTYCDIECLLTDGEMWYMLDECGNWAYLPAWYKVEVV
jgi:hypothetical protein